MKKKTKRWLWFTVATVFVITSWTGMGIWEWYKGFQADKTLSYLQLADDASDPQVKADYLEEFVVKIKQKDLPEYAAFIKKVERVSIVQQLIVVESLVKRCKETAQLPRESFGFAQGMEQITGQEFDHAVDSVQSVFYKALMMQYGFILYYTCIWWLILNFLLSCALVMMLIWAADTY